MSNFLNGFILGLLFIDVVLFVTIFLCLYKGSKG